MARASTGAVLGRPPADDKEFEMPQNASLGRLENIDVREVRQSEPRNFTS